MSIPVDVPDLRARTADYGWAYLVTVSASPPAHVVPINPVWQGDALAMLVGRRTAANVSAADTVPLCYPSMEEGGYSLIIDGSARVELVDADAKETHVVVMTPTAATLHRPAPAATLPEG